MTLKPFTVSFAGKPLDLVVNVALSNENRITLSQLMNSNALDQPTLEVDRSTGDIFYTDNFWEVVRQRIGALPSAERKKMAAGLAAYTAMGSALWLVGFLFTVIFNPILIVGVLFLMLWVWILGYFFGTFLLHVVTMIGILAAVIIGWGILSRRENLRRFNLAIPKMHRAILLAIAPLLKTTSRPAELFVELVASRGTVTPQEIFIAETTINAIFSPLVDSDDDILVALAPVNAFLPVGLPDRLLTQVEVCLREGLDQAGLVAESPAHIVDNNHAVAQLSIDGKQDIGLMLIEAGLGLPVFRGAEELLRAGGAAAARVTPVAEPTAQLHRAITALNVAMARKRGIWSEARDVHTIAEGKAMEDYLALLKKAEQAATTLETQSVKGTVLEVAAPEMPFNDANA